MGGCGRVLEGVPGTLNRTLSLECPRRPVRASGRPLLEQRPACRSSGQRQDGAIAGSSYAQPKGNGTFTFSAGSAGRWTRPSGPTPRASTRARNQETARPRRPAWRHALACRRRGRSRRLTRRLRRCGRRDAGDAHIVERPAAHGNGPAQAGGTIDGMSTTPNGGLAVDVGSVMLSHTRRVSGLLEATVDAMLISAA
jgi:hypothetical protein